MTNDIRDESPSSSIWDNVLHNSHPVARQTSWGKPMNELQSGPTPNQSHETLPIHDEGSSLLQDADGPETSSPRLTDSNQGSDTPSLVFGPRKHRTSKKKKQAAWQFSRNASKWQSRATEDPFLSSSNVRKDAIVRTRRATPDLQPISRTPRDSVERCRTPIIRPKSSQKSENIESRHLRSSLPERNERNQEDLVPEIKFPATKSAFESTRTPSPRTPERIRRRVLEPLDSPSPTRREKMQPQRPSKTKPAAASCVSALRDIKRNREKRREKQQHERRRRNEEEKQHGNDTGYKFRRLIKHFREKHGIKKDESNFQIPERNDNRLNVFVRKRPLNEKEKKAMGYDIVTCTEFKTLVCHEPKLKVDLTAAIENYPFTFDGVFDEEIENEQIYAGTVEPLIQDLSNRGTLTVFAYGQTGSGKTYTMKSVYRSASRDLFKILDQLKQKDLEVGFSFYEIYMGKVYDLLRGRKHVQVMEDSDGEVQIVGLRELDVKTAQDLLELISHGEEARATSKNAIHNDSSRSHAVARITLYQNDIRYARLSMVDLAGSERAGDTQTDSKQTRMEGAEINKSLLALKECIRALDVEATHIPFRGSKLTQILRDSFMSENARTVMIATISPSSQSSNYTLNTLRYADRLKEISSR